MRSRSFGLRFAEVLALAFACFAPPLWAATLPFDRTSPVIYDNDGAVESGFTDVYVMALASAGAIDLRGIISTGTNGEQPPYIPRSEAEILLERSELVPKARRSGLRNIPDPSPGPGVSMLSRRPASGRIEDTVPVGARGSWLIVNEARKATPSKPLVIIMGGQGTAVADAYLLDNSIADKLVVAWLVGARRSSNGLLSSLEYNAYVDSWATYIIFERLRVVAFPVDDAAYVPATPKARFGELPDTEIRQHLMESRWPRGSGYSEPDHNWDGLPALALTRPEFVLATKQISFDHWETDPWGGIYPIPIWKEDPNGRAMVAWQTDAALATQEWWARITDPAAWGTPAGAVPFTANGSPWPVPDIIEAEYFDDGGTNRAYFDTTNNWTSWELLNPFRFLEHVDIESSSSASGGYKVASAVAQEWMQYSIFVTMSDSYTLEVAVASDGTGGSFHVEFNGVDKTGPIQVPNTGSLDSWALVRKSAIPLTVGAQAMRIVMDTNGSTGQVGNFDYFRLIAASASPLVTIAATTANAAEAGHKPGVFTLTRTGDVSAPLTVTYTVGGSATNGTDYAPLSGTLTFQSGQGSGTVVVSPVDDTLAEGSETVVLTLVTPLTIPAPYIVGYPGSATVTIADDDATTVTIVATDNNAAEGTLKPGRFTISRTGSTAADLQVSYSIGGTATNGTDYQRLSGSVTIAAGQSSATISVIPIEDTISEGNELVILTLIDGNGYFVGTPGAAIVTIIDDEKATVSAAPTTIMAGDSVTATWSGIPSPSGTDWIALTTQSSANNVYQAWIYVSCTKSAGAAKSSGACQLPTSQSLSAGSYELRLFANDGFTRLATSNAFVVTGPLPVVTIVATDNTATEAGQTTGFFTVSRSGSTAEALTVNYTVGGTAGSGDYQALNGTLMIPANQSSATITVTPIDDSEIEGDETVIVTLASHPVYTVGSLGSATVTITDDDAPVITIAAEISTSSESGPTPGSFRVSRSGSSAVALTVNYIIGGTAVNGTDYQTLLTTVTIGAGQSSALITVIPIDDSAFEGSETVVLTLAAGAGYGVGNPASAMVTITDNDATNISVSPGSIAAGGTVTIAWNNIVSPTSTDWLALAPLGSANNVYHDWLYVSCAKTAGITRASGTCSLTTLASLAAGSYELRLFAANGFTRLATSGPFAVTGPLPVLTIVATGNTATEAGQSTGLFTVRRIGSTVGALTVNYTVGGTASSTDYQALSGSVVIANNQTSATITVTPINDSEIEGDETVIVTLSASALYTIGVQASATVTIIDDDAPVVTIVANANAAEPATSGQFTVTRSGSTALALTVNYTIGGTATNGTDYQTLPASVTIGAGQSAVTIAVTPIDDSALEGSETVVLMLATGVGYSVGNPASATVAIIDDDGTGISVSPGSIAAGGTITIAWNNIVNPTSTDWVALAPVGTANGVYQDWIYVSCAKSAGSARTSGSCPLTVSASLGAGNYELRLFAANGFTRLASSSAFAVTGPLSLPVVTITADANAAEPASTGQFTVRRSGSTASILTVYYAVSSASTALSGVDYQMLPGNVTIAVGEATAAIAVSVIDDGVYEGNETIIITLSTNTNYTVGNPNSATLTITDDDPVPPGPSLSVSPGTASRGTSVIATWSGILSPTAGDWIGLYAVGAPNSPFWAWQYVSCTTSPNSPRAAGTCGFPIPFTPPPGSYELRLFSNGGYNRLATSGPVTLQ